MNSARRIGVALASLHLGLFVATVSFIHASSDPQASLAWMIWAIVDFPWSLLYLLAGPTYSSILAGVEAHSPAAAMFVYLPHLIHGVIGTIWWLLLPTIALRAYRLVKKD